MITIGCWSQRYIPQWDEALPPLPSPSCSSAVQEDSVALSSLGHRVAHSTLEAASHNEDLSKMRCYHFVKAGLRSEGISLSGTSAYQAARQLALEPHFQEKKGIKRDQLADLPEGSIVVWNRNSKHPDGHISVALGDGLEVSDRVRRQITKYQSSYRVFEPR